MDNASLNFSILLKKGKNVVAVDFHKLRIKLESNNDEVSYEPIRLSDGFFISQVLEHEQYLSFETCYYINIKQLCSPSIHKHNL